MPIPTPKKGERRNEFVQRCMSDEKMIKEYDQEQRAAICQTAFTELASMKISFDYDGTLSTKKGTELAKRLKDEGNTIYIISARGSKDNMLTRAESIGIPTSRIYATGSNKAKVEKIKELGIDIHYDNNSDVIKELGAIGNLF